MGSSAPKVSQILKGAHWRALRLPAEDALVDGRASAGGVRAMDRWLRAHQDRARALLTVDDALSFFSGTMTRTPISILVRTMQAIAPEHPHLPSLAAALVLRARATRQPKPHPPRTLEVSVPLEALPVDWQDRLADMRAGIRRGCAAPAPAVVETIEKALRRLAKAAEVAGTPVALSIPAASAAVHAMLGRGLAASTIKIELIRLRAFADYIGAPDALRDALRAEARFHRHQAALDGKTKERFLLESGLCLEDVARTALRCYREAPAEVHTAERHLLWIRAALFAVVICRPLRPFDVRRLVIGQHLRRDAEGWSLWIQTRKNKFKMAGRLWDLCTPYLDGAILLGADECYFWPMYERAQGRHLLAGRDGAPLHAHWVMRQSKRHLGAGIGIVRTLWHDHCAAVGTKRAVEVALAICGQHDPRTTFHYRTEASSRQLLVQGQDLLADIAQGLIS